ncbi:MAG: hypothetical protein U0P81_15470 [Holophagaceae bacterium]
MGRRIAILFHESDREREGFYSVSRMVPVWRSDGHEVVSLFGVEEFVPADLVFVHVDLSDVPEPYLAFAARYPAAVNGRVRSIRKRTFSPHLLARGDAWAGPVIVKSDRNYGGWPEALRGLPRLDGQGTRAPFASPLYYRVLDRLADVPPEIFDSEDFVVQRFLPELEDGLYHVRTYTFLGDWGDCQRLASESPVVKADSKVFSGPAPVDPRVEALRAEAGLDYGKIDFLYHGGELVVLDLNKTIGSRGGGREANPHLARARAARARGLYALFPPDAPPGAGAQPR